MDWTKLTTRRDEKQQPMGFSAPYIRKLTVTCKYHIGSASKNVTEMIAMEADEANSL